MTGLSVSRDHKLKPVVRMTPTFDANPLIHMDTPGIFFDTPEPAAGSGRKGTMIQLALRLTKLSVNALKNLAATIKTGLTGNANFPTPTTTPTMIQTAIDNVTTAEADLSAAEATVVMKSENLENKLQALRDTLNAVGIECLDKVKNDPEDTARMKLMSANLPLKSAGAPVGELDRPENLSCTIGDHEGEIDGGCDRVTNAKMYRARYATSPSGPWTVGYEGSKSSFTLKSLTPGAEYWIEIAAFGSGAWTEWSDPARCRAA